MLRTRVSYGPGLFPELEGDWKELVHASTSATPFQTLEWQSTWWRHYGGLKKPLAVQVWEGADLVGLFPLVVSRGPWRTMRPMGIGPSDYLHPLVRDGYEAPVGEELATALKQMRDVDLLDLHQLRETRALADHFPTDPIEQARCLVLELPDTFDGYLQQIGKSLRYDVRRLDKDLFRSGRAEIEFATDPNAGLEILFDQHVRRWKRRGLPGAFVGKSKAFHREWAKLALDQGWLWLSVLKLDGQPIGAVYAMTLGKTTYYYQAGFDPGQGSVSPGTLLVAQTIRRAIEEGKSHFDFMRGDESYKRRWKPQHTYRNLRVLAPAQGMLAQAGSRWNRTGSQVESRIRARFEGRGLL